MATERPSFEKGQKVVVSRESSGKVVTTEPAVFVGYGKTKASLYVQLANRDVIKRKARQVEPATEETK